MWLILGDTHKDKNGARQAILEDAITNWGVSQIIHTGDMNLQEFTAEAYQGLPVAVALIEEQLTGGLFDPRNPPTGWQVTVPGNRVITVFVHGIYLGHKIGWDCLTRSLEEIQKKIEEIRKNNDGIRFAFCGHSHFPFMLRDSLISLINPGYAEEKYEYALLDPDSGEIVFTRLPFEPIPRSEIVNIGVITDTERITKKDSTFWLSLAAELKKRNVTNLIHCGNIHSDDIGRPELTDFTVHCCLPPVQRVLTEKKFGAAANWLALDNDEPIVGLGGGEIYVDYNLHREVFGDSGFDLDKLSAQIRLKHQRVKYVLFGGSYKTIYEKGDKVTFIDPGDVISSRSFAVIELPRRSFTFARIPRPAPSQPYAD